MKTEDILLIGGVAVGAWYLWSNKAEAQPSIEGLLGGGGGGGSFDLSSLLAGLNLGAGLGGGGGGGGFDLSSLLAGMNLGQAGSGLDMSALLASWGDMFKNLNLGGAGSGGLDIKGFMQSLTDMFKNINLGGLGRAGGTNITDTIKKAIDDATKSWTAPWGGITDPLHQANVNLAETGKGITGAIGAVTAVGRTAIGGFTNAVTFQAPWYSYLFGPVGAVIGGMWTEAGQIVSEKNAAQGTVKLGPATLATIQQYGGEAALHAAAQQLVIAQQKGLTPQKQAAAQEVNLGLTTEGPSGLYSGSAQPAAVLKAAIIDQRLPEGMKLILQKIAYA